MANSQFASLHALRIDVSRGPRRMIQPRQGGCHRYARRLARAPLVSGQKPGVRPSSPACV